MTTTMTTPATNAAAYMTDTTIFRITHTIPHSADHEGQRRRDLFLEELDCQERHAKQPPYRRGNKYKVIAGRKYPHGLVGVLFWTGQNTYGVSVGLSTSSRKLENGRAADVIFTTPGNLQFIPDADTLAKIEEQRASADNVYLKKFKEVIDEMLDNLAVELGVDVSVLRQQANMIVDACIPMGADSVYGDQEKIVLMKKYLAATA
jgi:hypothetical protein